MYESTAAPVPSEASLMGSCHKALEQLAHEELVMSPSDVVAGNDGHGGYLVTGVTTFRSSGSGVQFVCKIAHDGRVRSHMSGFNGFQIYTH